MTSSAAAWVGWAPGPAGWRVTLVHAALLLQGITQELSAAVKSIEQMKEDAAQVGLTRAWAWRRQCPCRRTWRCTAHPRSCSRSLRGGG
jgi:hypothetical protein